MMESNRDESQKCVEIAIHFINDGRRDRALKFLYKADRLYPSQRAKDLIELLEKLSGDSSYYTKPESSSSSTSDEDKKQMFSKRESENDEDDYKENRDPDNHECTQQNLEDIQRITNCKDYYHLLGVKKDSGESELKKQYRRLSLLFHPDKNKTPGADEAFKAIGNAFAVLNDPVKRKEYDLFKAKEFSKRKYSYCQSHSGFRNNSHPYNRARNGGMPRERKRFQRKDTQPENLDDSGLIPKLILAVVCLSLACTLYVAEPTYSLAKTMKFNQELRTRNLKVPYYVKESFARDYSGSITKLEADVEDDYAAHLKTSCFKERNYKETMIWRAKNRRDRNLEEKAKALKTPSCDTLFELYNDET